MKTQDIKSLLILLLAAAIWGFAFVAQRVGMQYVGAFTFNGIRFGLGCISLIPIMYIFKKTSHNEVVEKVDNKTALKCGIITGFVLFVGASLQQIGLIYTPAGKAGFITSLYIVIVPILGLFLKQKTNASTWIGAITATIGLYFISVNKNFSIETSDMLVLIGAFFWAVHLILIDKYVMKINAIKLSFMQFAVSSVLSLIAAFIYEEIEMSSILQAAIPFLYGGIMSTGVAFTLQAVGQKNAKASHAAIALSMESVFAAIGGFLILREKLPLKSLFGCLLILVGMLISQSENFKKSNLDLRVDIKDNSVKNNI